MSEDKKEFKVFTVSYVTPEMGSFVHWSEGLVMYIVKDGVTLKLEANEIEQVVAALPRTTGGTY